nr:hypothetical protein [Tanacetum cinerariifolium]
TCYGEEFLFFNDILIYSRSKDDHIQHLNRVLTTMKKNKLLAKESKCVFGGRSIEYLCHIISEEGVKTDPKKIEVVQQWPVSKTIKQLRGLLGLAGYYHRFIRFYEMIAKPLTDLLKKDTFKWSEEAKIAFDKLKEALTSAPILALPDPTKQFILETYASVGGLSAVLMFKWNGNWLVKENRMVVGGSAELRDEIVKLCHESPIGGHSGVNATVQRVKGLFFWRGITKVVRRIIRSCDVCKHARHENVASPGLLQPLPIPNGIFSNISMDFIGGLPKVKAEWWYNTSFHSSLGRTPFEALYGYRPPLHIPYIPRDVADQDVDELMRDREAAIKVLRQSLLKAQNCMKQQADKHQTERVFKPGSWVYLKLQPYMKNLLRVHKHSKLTPKYFGPFLIVEKVGAVAYRLDLPSDALIYPVFHVSLLKEADGSPTKIIPISEEARFCLWPSVILDRKLVKRKNRAAMKVLVQWKDQSEQDATWEFLDELQLRFPDFSELVSYG